ncbi:AlbA family DNA-binding domain-containing protein [Paraburkholderia megapolitana]|uniref:Putative DNA-binding domain-containing protein n=1 Tax=Paraburkholderia megapolitana TaxID=420953 RepID=A0A1I3VWT2_9BURK|nr:ATP-binding protein [Paraburkholderia megapolitana]SFJ99599.1 Putative DNA-binding domain-containing protein [Paraburkholderia megapolitana]
MIPRARLEHVTEADIQQLIDHGVREGRTLDYKRDWPTSPQERARIAEDVCAFANTLGGDLVFGLDEQEGVATAIVPIPLKDVDAALREVTSAIRDLHEPKITSGLQPWAVSIASGGYVVVLRVAVSPNAPHRTTTKNHFYGRTSVGKEPMDMHAIRHAFASNTSLVDQVLARREATLQSILTHTSPAPQLAGPTCVCQIVPLAAITRPQLHDVDMLRSAARRLEIAGPGQINLHPPTINLDGVACISDRVDHVFRAYAQLYRNGSVELVAGDLSRCIVPQRGDEEVRAIFPDLYEVPLVRTGFPAMLDALAELDVAPPAYLMLSWTYTGRTLVAVQQRGAEIYAPLPDHIQTMVAPPIYLESFDIDPLTTLRPAFDVFWNAVGIAHTQTDFARR